MAGDDEDMEAKGHRGIFNRFSGYKVGDEGHMKSDTQSYSEWRKLFLSILGNRGLATAVTSSNSSAWNNLSREQNKKAGICYESLLKDLRGRALTKVLSSEFPDLRSAFKSLESKYNPASDSARHVVIKKWLSDPQGEGEDISEFFGRKKSVLTDDLGGRITEQELLRVAILGKLEDSYEDAAIALLADDRKTLDQCEAVLQEHELHQRENKKTEEIADAHMIVKNAKSRKNNKKRGKKPQGGQSSSSSSSSNNANTPSLRKAIKTEVAKLVKGQGGKKTSKSGKGSGAKSGGGWGGGGWGGGGGSGDKEGGAEGGGVKAEGIRRRGKEKERENRQLKGIVWSMRVGNGIKGEVRAICPAYLRVTKL